MSKILVLGSVNIDEVFNVENIVQPGQTVHSKSQQIFPGGKGNITYYT